MENIPEDFEFFKRIKIRITQVESFLQSEESGKDKKSLNPYFTQWGGGQTRSPVTNEWVEILIIFVYS